MASSKCVSVTGWQNGGQDYASNENRRSVFVVVLVFMARMAVKVGMGVLDSTVGVAMGVNEICP